MVYVKIKSYLERNGIKQKTVAEKIGMNQNSFCAILSGRRRLLADEFLKICETLDVSPLTFWKGETYA